MKAVALRAACYRLQWLEVMTLPWFKFWSADYLSDPKVRNLTAEQHSCWLHLLCFAANATEPGVINFLDEESLLAYAGVTKSNGRNETVTERVTHDVLQAFIARGMIEIDGSKITILNWEKRQGMALTNAERQALYRQRKRNETVTAVTTKVTLAKKRVDKIKKDIYVQFEEFWKLYPNKKDKKNSQRKWEFLSYEKQLRVMEDLPKRLKSSQWLKDGGRYIPMPTTYLNGERWEDEITEEQPAYKVTKI